jgi:Protein of unknown function (DUF5672)
MTTTTRLLLPQVTLVAIDTRAPALALAALLRSMQQVDFGRVVLFTHQWAPMAAPPNVEIIDCGPIASGAHYSHFVLRRLPAHIQSSHALITQWDGFVVDAAAWDNAFLAHDYIGPVWPDAPAGRQVGNGGFSLRSRRVLAAGLDQRIGDEHPEDEMLCRRYRDLLEHEHGVRFAPPELARRFGFENEAPRRPTFGFHGPYHLPRFIDEPELATWLAQLPDAFFRSRDGRRLTRALLRHRMPHLAAQVVQRRRAAGLDDLKTRSLGWAAWMMGARGG